MSNSPEGKEKEILSDLTGARKNCFEALELLAMLEAVIRRIDNRPREAKDRVDERKEQEWDGLSLTNKVSTLRGNTNQVMNRISELYHLLDSMV